MSVAQAPNVSDKFSNHLIRRTARILVSEGTFAQADFEDVIQDLQVALIEQAGNYDSARATWSTFVKTVIRLAAITLRRRRYAERRSAPADLVSLNILIEDADGQLTELGMTVGEEEYRTGLGQDFVSHTDQVNRAVDVAATLAALPEELLQICELLKVHSVSEVARRLRISRKKILLSLEVLRDRFERAGLATEE